MVIHGDLGIPHLTKVSTLFERSKEPVPQVSDGKPLEERTNWGYDLSENCGEIKELGRLEHTCEVRDQSYESGDHS